MKPTALPWIEGATIRAELERTRHNMTETAKALGLERSHLYKKCAQLGIQLKQLRHRES
jgi:DNA-binding NtrC family response regulator